MAGNRIGTGGAETVALNNTVMGRLIPFYVPDSFRLKVKVRRASEPAKVIKFRPVEARKPA